MVKLSELVEHTGYWTGYSATSVGSYARFLRQARLISGGVKGGGAADMTDRDKVSLLVAVLACGTARTCDKQLPSLLDAVPSKPVQKTMLVSPSDPHSEIDQPPFFFSSNTATALIDMFRSIHDGRLDSWRENVARKLADRMRLRATDFELELTFETDVNLTEIEVRLKALLPDRPLSLTISSSLTFGRPAQNSLPGYSRRFHKISYERLAGWGTCLIER